MTPAPRRMGTAAELRAGAMAEEELQREVLRIATRLGWRSYHTHDSRRSTAGFPDLVLVHARQRRTLFVELKRQSKSPTDEQAAWLADLTAAGQTAAVWRPSDLLSGHIAKTLIAPTGGGTS